MKKTKIFLTFVLLLFVACSGILFGCADKYKDMKIKTTETELVFSYGGTNEEEVVMQKSFTASVLGVPKDVSTDLKYVLTNDIVDIRQTKQSNGDTLFELFAKEGVGTTADLIIKSIESDKVKVTIHISIICKISSITPNQNFSSDAFVEVGEQITTKKIAQNAVIYQPDGTSQKSLTYSLKQNIAGILIEGDNIVIDPQTLPANISDFEIIATSVENTEVSTTLSYHIVKKFNVLLQNEAFDLENYIFLTTNTQNTDKNPVVLSVDVRDYNGSDAIFDRYTVYSQLYVDAQCTTIDTRRMVNVATDNDQVLLTAREKVLDNPYSYLKVCAKLDEYNFEAEPYILKIETQTIATEVYVEYLGETKIQTINYDFEDGEEPEISRKVNGNDVDVTSEATYQIYDGYYNDADGHDYGSKFVITVGKDNDMVKNKKFVLYAPSEDHKARYEIRNKDGNILDVLTSLENIEALEVNALNSGDVIYVKALDTSKKSVLQIVSIASVLHMKKNVAYTMIFNSTSGVSGIEFHKGDDSAKVIMDENDLNIAYIPFVDIDGKTKIIFDVEGETSSLSVNASSDIVLLNASRIVKNDDGKFELFVSKNPRYQFGFGNVVLTLTADNNFSERLTIKLFPKVNGIKVGFLNSVEADKYTSDIELDEEDGSVLKFALAKGNSISLDYIATYNSKIQNATIKTEYSGFDDTIISIISNDIYMIGIGTETIHLKFSFIDEEEANGIKTIERDLTIIGYLAVRSYKLSESNSNAKSFVLYSADTLGIDYIKNIGDGNTANNTVYNYKKLILSLTYSDGSAFDGVETESLQVSWTISSSSNKFIFRELDERTYQLLYNNEVYFEASRTDGNVFEVSALRGDDENYDAFLTATITQLGKKYSVQNRFLVKKAIQIDNIGNLLLKDNSTGREQYVSKDSLGNAARDVYGDNLGDVAEELGKQVYYVYKPFTQVLENRHQYEITANIHPQNVLVDDLDFSIYALEYNQDTHKLENVQLSNDEVVVSKHIDIKTGKVVKMTCDIKVNDPGTYKLIIASKDSQTVNGYNKTVEIYFTFADGTKDAQFRISTSEEFEDMLRLAAAGKYYVIVNDIDISSIDSRLIASVDLESNIDGSSFDSNGEQYFAKITGIYLNYANNPGASSDFCVGLFKTITGEVYVQNINLVINQVDVVFESVANAYFGGLAGKNYGKILNVSVDYLSSIGISEPRIVDNANQSYIGGLVGQNNGKTQGDNKKGIYYEYTNQKALFNGVSGNLRIENSAVLMNAQRYVGGLVGENNGDIVSESIFFNNPAPNSNYNSSLNISVADNVLTQALVDHAIIALGGVVGNNTGILINVSYSGKLSGGDNVGGVVGNNSGTMMTGAFAEAQVVGKSNVGGIVGYSIADIKECAVLFYSKENYIKGENNVGGIVGKIVDANIEYCYVKSFVDAESGDIQLKSSIEAKYLGGIAGYAEGETTLVNISKSYSQAKLYTQNAAHYVGGIVGQAKDVRIDNAFERNNYNIESNTTIGLVLGQMSGTCSVSNFYCAYENRDYDIGIENAVVIKPTSENYLINGTYDLPENIWYNMLKLNSDSDLADYPFIKYGESTPIKLLTIEQPTSVTISIANNSDKVVKVGDNTFVIWRDGPDEILFSTLFKAIFSANNSDISDADIALLNIAQDYFLKTAELRTGAEVSENELVAIVNKTDGAYRLRLLREGETQLIFTSKANGEVSKAITIFVKNRIKNLGVSISAAENNGVYQFVANTTYQIKTEAEDANNYYIEVTSNENMDKISVNGTLLIDGANITTNTINSIMTLTKFDSTVDLLLRPYIIYNNKKIYCGEAEIVKINSVYGISSFELDTILATLSPNSKLALNAEVVGENLGTVSDDYVSDTMFSYKITDENGEALDLSMLNIYYNPEIEKDENNTNIVVKINYAITISINYDVVKNNDYFDKKLYVTFTFTLNEKAKESRTIEIVLKKLSLQNISTDFYKHVQKTSENDTYTSSQVSSNSIIAGNLGILQVNLTPAETDIESIVVYHSQSDGYAMNFTQLVKYGENFLDIGAYAKTAKNGFGIQVFKMSNYGTDKLFDGNIYVGMVISSKVPQGTQFNVFVEVAYNGGQIMTHSLTLYSEKESAVLVSYDFNGTICNSDNGATVFIPLDVEKVITIKASDLFSGISSREEIAKAFSFRIGGVSTNIKVDGSEVNIDGDSVYVNLPITISKYNNGYRLVHLNQEYISISEQLIFETICTRTTASSNKEFSSKKAINFIPMPFVVKSVSVKAQTSDGKLENVYESLSIKKDIATVLVAKLDCEYSQNNKIVADGYIDTIEKELNRNVGYWQCNLTNYSDVLSYEVIDERIVLEGKRVYNEINFGIQLPLDFDEFDSNYNTYKYSLSEENREIQMLTHYFDLSIYRDVADKGAVPVASLTQFKNMKSGNDYRLVPMTLESGAVMELEDYLPFALPENVTFDGNGMTILIKSFYKAYSGINYGLFASIGQGSVVKNLVVKYANDLTLDLTESGKTSLSFGGVVAENNGTLYNCKVEGKVQLNLPLDITASIGGMIAANAGFASYCEVNLALNSNIGQVAGFVSANRKKISASKVIVPESAQIENSNNQVNERSTLAGFAAKNTGEIDGCYVSAENNGKLKSNAALAGFVFENSGKVSNSYVNVMLEAGRAGGFVYTNSGDIKSAYTKLTLTEEEYNSNQIAPFVGVDQLSGVVNNSGNIDDCYYYSAQFGSAFGSNQIAKKLSSDSFEKSNFEKFIFTTDATKDDGIWKDNSDLIDSELKNPTLVEADREIVSHYSSYDAYYERIKDSDDNDHYVLAQFIDANKTYYQKKSGIADLQPSTYAVYVHTSDVEFDATKVYYKLNESDEYVAIDEFDSSKMNTYYEKTEYFNVDVLKIDIENAKEPTENTADIWGETPTFGTKNNPRTIANADDWNNQLNKENGGYYALLCDIELSDTPITAYNYTFEGKLLANNMSVNKLYINESEISEYVKADSYQEGKTYYQINSEGKFEIVSSPNMENISNYYEKNIEKAIQKVKSMGLFAELDAAMIKNLNISTSYNISANDIEKVGILTGYAKDSNIIDIDIQAENAVVIGKNFVGGVAGVLKNSTLVGANVAANVNAVFAKAGQYLDLDSKFANYKDDDENNTVEYSYAGAVVGVLTGNTKAILTNVSGNSKVIGYYIGLAFGLVNQNATVSYSSAKIVPEQYIKGFVLAGGLVGENRGTVECSQTLWDASETRNLTFFAGNAMFVGGLVGFNNGGTITSCYSTIDVRSTEQNIVNSSYVVGGLVGLDVGGLVEYCYVTGSVRGEYILGGLIGAVSIYKYLSGSLYADNQEKAYVVNDQQYYITPDTEIDSNKFYYTKVGGNKYNIVASPTNENISTYYESSALKLTNCFASNQWIYSTSSADDSQFISDTRAKGMIIGSFVDEELGFSKFKLYNYISQIKDVYFNTADSTFNPNGAPIFIDGANGTFTAGKYMKAFQASVKQEKIGYELAVRPYNSSIQYYIYENGTGQYLLANNTEEDRDYYIKAESDIYDVINKCSFGGMCYEFVTSGFDRLAKEQIANNCIGTAFINGALICNANNGDYEIIYGKNGIYKNWEDNEGNSEFILPYKSHSSIYPTLIVNINK